MTIRRPRPGVLVALAATAGLAWLGTGLHPWWPALWLAPIPVLVLATRASARTAGATAFAAWVVGGLNLWGYYTGTMRMPPAVALALLGAGGTVCAGAVLLFRALLVRGRPWLAVAAFPATWASAEYVVSLGSPHGEAWSLAYTQLDLLPLVQLAAATGPWGITFAVLLLPAALAVAVDLRPRYPDRASSVFIAAAAAIAAVLAFGSARLAKPAGPTIRVALLASDAPAWAGVPGEGAATAEALGAYAREAAKLSARGARVIVLPEKLGVVAGDALAEVDQRFQSVADAGGATVAVGLVHTTPARTDNEARVYRPGAPPVVYAKHHLLPFFEARFTPGTQLATVPADGGAPWGVAICKDLDFASPARRYGAAGAGLLLVPAWDFVVDGRFHGRIAVLRGVESGFAVVRAARQGLLTVSDSRGRVIAEARSDAAPFASLVAEVPVSYTPTLYVRIGDAFAWLSLAVVAVGLHALRRRRAVRAVAQAG